MAEGRKTTSRGGGSGASAAASRAGAAGARGGGAGRGGKGRRARKAASTAASAASAASAAAGEGRSAGVRLQRVMADAGIASRRECEAMIERGAVSVNGRVVKRLPVLVKPGVDRVEVNGRPLPARERHLYIMLNKPGRTISSVSDARDGGAMDGIGRRTVLDLVNHPAKARLFPVGRLDYETRGLVLLTNDGDLANQLTHPRYGVHKTYQAVLRGYLEESQIAELEEGIFLAERRAGKTEGARRASHVKLEIVKRDRDRTVVLITLREGRNRQVRRMLVKVGCPVKSLERIAIGPLRLKGLRVGDWRELGREELRALRGAVSRKAVEAGAELVGEGSGVGARSPGGAGSEEDTGGSGGRRRVRKRGMTSGEVA